MRERDGRVEMDNARGALDRMCCAHRGGKLLGRGTAALQCEEPLREHAHLRFDLAAKQVPHRECAEVAHAILRSRKLNSSSSSISATVFSQEWNKPFVYATSRFVRVIGSGSICSSATACIPSIWSTGNTQSSPARRATRKRAVRGGCAGASSPNTSCSDTQRWSSPRTFTRPSKTSRGL